MVQAIQVLRFHLLELEKVSLLDIRTIQLHVVHHSFYPYPVDKYELMDARKNRHGSLKTTSHNNVNLFYLFNVPSRFFLWIMRDVELTRLSSFDIVFLNHFLMDTTSTLTHSTNERRPMELVALIEL